MRRAGRGCVTRCSEGICDTDRCGCCCCSGSTVRCSVWRDSAVEWSCSTTTSRSPLLNNQALLVRNLCAAGYRTNESFANAVVVLVLLRIQQLPAAVAGKGTTATAGRQPLPPLLLHAAVVVTANTLNALQRNQTVVIMGFPQPFCWIS
jgi:hypothetical protein